MRGRVIGRRCLRREEGSLWETAILSLGDRTLHDILLLLSPRQYITVLITTFPYHFIILPSLHPILHLSFCPHNIFDSNKVRVPYVHGLLRAKLAQHPAIGRKELPNLLQRLQFPSQVAPMQALLARGLFRLQQREDPGLQARLHQATTPRMQDLLR